MPASKPMKTVVASFRMTEEEKARWDAYCEEHDVTLAHAVRGGLKLYMDEFDRLLAIREERRRSGVEPAL